MSYENTTTICWCGSGSPYSECHKDRDKQERPKLDELINNQRKSFSSKLCLHPEAPKNCSKIIRAHTIQRSGSLSRIARDGHVYSLQPDLIALIRNNGILVPTLRGIGQVSIINGFCAHHDSSFFSPLENQPFKWTPEQCFLLGYRSLARELYGKLSFANQLEIMKHLDGGMPPLRKLLYQHFISNYSIGTALALNDLKYLKRLYDRIYSSNDFHQVRFYGFELDKPPDVLCSVGMTPSYDMNGNRLQDLNDTEKRMASVAFNLLSTHNGGFAVFSWLPEADIVASKFIHSLEMLDKSILPDALIRLAFNETDNLAINPDWWDSISSSHRDSFQMRIQHDADPRAKKMPLWDDGVRVADFNWVRTVHSI